ncbi:MAG: hypothetical protein P8X52_08010, partial [Limibacillus sp.]
VDLTYETDYLGAGPDSLKELAEGKGAFAEVLEKAEKPMIILGSGVLVQHQPDALIAMPELLEFRRIWPFFPFRHELKGPDVEIAPVWIRGVGPLPKDPVIVRVHVHGDVREDPGRDIPAESPDNGVSYLLSAGLGVRSQGDDSQCRGQGAARAPGCLSAG